MNTGILIVLDQLSAVGLTNRLPPATAGLGVLAYPYCGGIGPSLFFKAEMP